VCISLCSDANIILWRNTQISTRIFAGVTVTWFLFECIGYHLLTLVCHFLILSSTTVFLWSNLASYINVWVPLISTPYIFLNTAPHPCSVFIGFLDILVVIGKLLPGSCIRDFCCNFREECSYQTCFYLMMQVAPKTPRGNPAGWTVCEFPSFA